MPKQCMIYRIEKLESALGVTAEAGRCSTQASSRTSTGQREIVNSLALWIPGAMPSNEDF